MNNFKRRLLDNSDNNSNPSSIRNLYNKSNINYIQLNSSLKKLNYQNSFLNVKIQTPINFIPKPSNSIYHSVLKKNNEYINSETTLYKDKRYNNIKQLSKNLQNRLDKLIIHSKKIKLENERNKSIRREYFNRPHSTQKINNFYLSNNFIIF